MKKRKWSHDTALFQNILGCFDVYCLHIGGIIQNEIETKKLILNTLHRKLCMPHKTYYTR